MRFMSVLFLAAIQLTAVPFVTLLYQNSLRQPQVAQIAMADHNVSIVYKQHASN